MTDMLSAVPLSSADDDPQGFADRIGSAFAGYGFAVVSDHGIDPALIEEAEAKMRKFFALPEAAKRAYHVEGGSGARGYTPFGIEQARDATTRDLKEFWHVGRPLPEGHRFASVMPPNIWPGEVPGFRKTFLALYAAFEQTGLRILTAIARYLGLAPDFFDDTVKDGNSVLRLLHYPPVPDGAEAVRAAAHEDINPITLLLGAEEAGLELRARDGRWIPVSPDEGELVVNIGDMLQRLTNHRLPSTTHRVANPPEARRGSARYSMPFFLHFRPDYLIETLPECIAPQQPDRYPEPVTAQDYLQQRLREIGLA